MTDNADYEAGHTYPLAGTCDVCAEGGKPLRVADPETESWICERCSNAEDRAIHAMGDAMRHLWLDDEGNWYVLAEQGLKAYFGSLAEPQPLPPNDGSGA